MNEYIQKMISIGFNESEAKVYYNLLHKSNFSAAEIAKISGISKTKIYEVLDKLITNGLCVETAGKVKKYSSINPEIVFNEINRKLNDKRDLSEVLLKHFVSIYRTQKDNSDDLDYIQIIRDKKTIADKFYEMESKTKKEILAFDKPPYAMNVKIEQNQPEQDCFKRGVVAKVVYEIPKIITPEFIKRVKMYHDFGEQIRLAYELPIKMTVFDDKRVIFVFNDKFVSKLSLTSILIEHIEIVKVFKITFDVMWENSMSFDEFINSKKEYI